MSTAPITETIPSGRDADPLLPRLARVRRRRREGPQVLTLEIETSEDSAPGAAAGQFNMLTAFGVGEVPISVSGDTADPRRLIHTIRAVGPVSTALSRLQAGAALGIRGPFGIGWPMGEAVGRDVVIVAGGLGMAPLRPALYRLLAERGRYGRIVLLYGTRSPEEILYAREIAQWRQRLDIDIEVTVDHATGSWNGHVGVVTTLLSRGGFDPRDTLALVCGPEVMMRFTAAALGDAGVADEAIWLSVERNMKCGVGLCGHCQLGTVLVCRDGPVLRYDRLRDLLAIRQL